MRRADVLITADAPRADVYEACNVCAVIEVMTAVDSEDPGVRRMDEYRGLNDVRYVLVVDSRWIDAALLSRDGDGWISDGFIGRDAIIPLPEIKCRLAMADVYEGVAIEGVG